MSSCPYICYYYVFLPIDVGAPVTYRDCCCDNREKGKYILFEEHRSILCFSMVQGHVIQICVFNLLACTMGSFGGLSSCWILKYNTLSYLQFQLIDFFLWSLLEDCQAIKIQEIFFFCHNLMVFFRIIFKCSI